MLCSDSLDRGTDSCASALDPESEISVRKKLWEQYRIPLRAVCVRSFQIAPQYVAAGAPRAWCLAIDAASERLGAVGSLPCAEVDLSYSGRTQGRRVSFRESRPV